MTLSTPDHDILEDVLRREGNIYTDRADDPGGPTKYGITLADLRVDRPDATAADVAALTKDEAVEIFARRYLVRPGFTAVSYRPLRALLVDFGVHSGPAQAIKELQRLLGVEDDGILGPITVAAANLYPSPRVLLNRLAVARILFLAGIVARKPEMTWALVGWMRRATEFLIP